MSRRPVSLSTLIQSAQRLVANFAPRDLALSAKAAFSYLNYGTPVVQGIDTRSDIKVNFDTVASYSINAGLVFAFVNQLEVLNTSFTAPNGINPTYTANSTFLRIAFRY